MNKQDQIKATMIVEIDNCQIMTHVTPGGFETMTLTQRGVKESTISYRSEYEAVQSAIRLYVKTAQAYRVRVTLPENDHICLDIHMFDLESRWRASALLMCDLSRYEYVDDVSRSAALVTAIWRMLP